MTERQKSDFPRGMKCSDCGWCGSTYRASCPTCRGRNLVEAESSGRGKIVDVVPVLYPPENLKDLGPYVSVLVQFDEGFRMFGMSLVEPEELTIGTSVVVSSFDKDTMRLFFDKA